MGLRVMNIFGTRPEAIKMAPVVRALAATPGVASLVCVTGQHRRMLDQALHLFGIEPDYDLKLMRPGQDLFDVTAQALLGLRGVLKAAAPDLVLVQGDTSTCFAGALAAFYSGIPVAHVEAGLRTGNLAKPFPEEANRVLTGRLTLFHFAPTAQARDNLLAEGVPADRVWVTGNTVIDALLSVRARLGAFPAETWRTAFGADLHAALTQTRRRMVLVTGHRRENFGRGFVDLCSAIRDLAARHPDWLFVYPVHLNPNVQRPVRRILNGCANVFLLPPLDYLPFVWLMDRACLVLTDSGGVQEEAPALGKPVLVMREETERPEAVAAGTARLVGTGRARIVVEAERLMDDAAAYRAMAQAHNPYGDGRAAGRIAEVLSLAFAGAARLAG